MTQIKTIDAADFTDKIKHSTDLHVLDIRTDLEYDALSLIYDVEHHPLHVINAAAFPKNESDTFILCKMGPRAMALAEKLADNGHTNLIVIDGGIMRCLQSGAPTNQADNQPASAEIMEAVQGSFQAFMMNNS